ncbi:MAG: hypothetical protein KA116_11750 [Proteobacteria bacterium]|nr:hypothetical protein [Pseudomonadota bacterium]
MKKNVGIIVFLLVAALFGQSNSLLAIPCDAPITGDSMKRVVFGEFVDTPFSGVKEIGNENFITYYYIEGNYQKKVAKKFDNWAKVVTNLKSKGYRLANKNESKNPALLLGKTIAFVSYYQGGNTSVMLGYGRVVAIQFNDLVVQLDMRSPNRDRGAYFHLIPHSSNRTLIAVSKGEAGFLHPNTGNPAIDSIIIGQIPKVHGKEEPLSLFTKSLNKNWVELSFDRLSSVPKGAIIATFQDSNSAFPTVKLIKVLEYISGSASHHQISYEDLATGEKLTHNFFETRSASNMLDTGITPNKYYLYK